MTAALATRSLETRKAEAAAVWQSHGVPHRRIEEWKYTDLRALMRDAKPLERPAKPTPEGIAGLASILSGVDASLIPIVTR